MYVCMCYYTHTHIPKYIMHPAQHYNVTCMYVFSAEHLTLDNHLVCSSLVGFFMVKLPEVKCISYSNSFNQSKLMNSLQTFTTLTFHSSFSHIIQAGKEGEKHWVCELDNLPG